MNEDKEIIIKLVEEIKELRDYVKVLEDENQSLWFILEELEQPNVNNSSEKLKNSQENFVKDQLNLLFTSKKVGEA
tara:strand:- start:736 stop:963 length:228 start_codon:yes stop_codon:yes gene_type:complete